MRREDFSRPCGARGSRIGCCSLLRRDVSIGSRLRGSSMGKVDVCLSMINGRCAQTPAVRRWCGEHIKADPDLNGRREIERNARTLTPIHKGRKPMLNSKPIGVESGFDLVQILFPLFSRLSGVNLALSKPGPNE
jgi:hypothetical protein